MWPSPSGDGILFNWHMETWREYIQKLIVRNVSTTVKKIKYKLPNAVLRLAPGGHHGLVSPDWTLYSR